MDFDLSFLEFAPVVHPLKIAALTVTVTVVPIAVLRNSYF